MGTAVNSAAKKSSRVSLWERLPYVRQPCISYVSPDAASMPPYHKKHCLFHQPRQTFGTLRIQSPRPACFALLLSSR
jgi:hypothetical protein